ASAPQPRTCTNHEPGLRVPGCPAGSGVVLCSLLPGCRPLLFLLGYGQPSQRPSPVSTGFLMGGPSLLRKEPGFTVWFCGPCDQYRRTCGTCPCMAQVFPVASQYPADAR